MAETWRVVLATGEVLSVECLYIGTVALAKVYGLRAEGVAVSGQGDNFVEAILDLARDGMLRVVEILAPGEPTRAELGSQLATVTAKHRDAEKRADEWLRDIHRVRALFPMLDDHRPYDLATHVGSIVKERDVLRAQQAPLLDAHDALVAAARAAGWTGAGATGAELVAWVRRGAMTTAAGIADDHGRTGVASAIRLAAMDLTGGE